MLSYLPFVGTTVSFTCPLVLSIGVDSSIFVATHEYCNKYLQAYGFFLYCRNSLGQILVELLDQMSWSSWRVSVVVVTLISEAYLFLWHARDHGCNREITFREALKDDV